MFSSVVPLPGKTATVIRDEATTDGVSSRLEERIVDLLGSLRQELVGDLRSVIRSEFDRSSSQGAREATTVNAWMLNEELERAGLAGTPNARCGEQRQQQQKPDVPWREIDVEHNVVELVAPNQVAENESIYPSFVPKISSRRPSEDRRMPSKKSFCSLCEDGEEEDKVAQLFKLIDVDNSKDVSKSEFIRAFKTDDSVVDFCSKHPMFSRLLNPRNFRAAFAEIDINNTKTISLAELREAVDKVNELSNEEEKTNPSTFDVSMTRGAFEIAHFQKSKLDEQIYDVSNFYRKQGYSQCIARSELFQNITLAIILMNAIYLGFDAEFNKKYVLMDSHWVFIIFEVGFCSFFVFEWFIRFSAFQNKRDCVKDKWFNFDSFLVALVVFETVVMPVLSSVTSADSSAVSTGPLRLLRLLRLTRLVRLMRSLPELLTIIKGMRAGFRAVTSSLLLIAVQVYIFAIVLHTLLKEDEVVKDHFSTLPRCMWTLLLDGTLLDSTGEVMDLLVQGRTLNSTISVVVFMIFVLFTAITVMNMLVGVLCEVVSSVAADEKDESAIKLMKQTVLLELQKFDDGDSCITEEELNELMADPAAVQVLETLGIDIPFLQEWQVMTFENPDTAVPIHDIIEQMLACRGDLHASVKHLVIQQNLNKWWMSNKILQHEKRMDRKLDSCCRRLVAELQPSVP
eukprot:TRINITY_DN23371_c0_g1_i1.p1 TRINITY_DN23371_c0_g1~~TRINITY_DN23371_c0_g1_i1.p1  ORF type:complete len:683 (-),score=128.37 TRINITY_DN23371_c0_g1_i1:127-2175(-)